MHGAQVFEEGLFLLGFNCKAHEGVPSYEAARYVQEDAALGDNSGLADLSQDRLHDARFLKIGFVVRVREPPEFSFRAHDEFSVCFRPALAGKEQGDHHVAAEINQRRFTAEMAQVRQHLDASDSRPKVPLRLLHDLDFDMDWTELEKIPEQFFVLLVPVDGRADVVCLLVCLRCSAKNQRSTSVGVPQLLLDLCHDLGRDLIAFHVPYFFRTATAPHLESYLA